MTYDEIKTELESLVALMQERGFVKVEAYCNIYPHGETRVICIYHVPKNDKREYIFGRGDTPVDALDDAHTKMAKLTSVKDLLVTSALAQLAQAMEAAKEAGIEDDLINPIKVVADRLAKNAIGAV